MFVAPYALPRRIFSDLWSQIGNTSFEDAASPATVYASMSALVLYLGLDRPAKDTAPKAETVLIWGGASALGFYAIQIAAHVRI